MSPGKFEGNSDEALAERLHERSLDGSWQSLGDVEGFGWYALVADGDDNMRRADWYVLCQDSQGFVTIVEGPMGDEEALSEWADLETEYFRWNQEGD